MPRTFVTLFALATLSAAAPLLAQSAYSAGPGNPDSNFADSNSAGSTYTQGTPAPIERNVAPDANYPQTQQSPQGQPGYSPSVQQRPMNQTSEPAHGVWLVSAPDASVQTVSTAADHVELRVERGRANVNVYHPADHTDILVDLPGGQASLLKDGLYTFNAESNTLRVLHGEAEISINNAKPIKVKEDHEFTFGAQAKSQDADPNQLRADLLQGNYGDSGGGYRHGDGYGYAPYGYGYGPYAYGWPYYGFYGPRFGYPYYAFGGPFGYGYPYGYGFGLGFGYYGGFGGFRGGYGGFRGGYGGFRGGYGGFRR